MQECGEQGTPAGGCELIDDDGPLGILQGVNPVDPHHPWMHRRLGNDEASHHHDG